MHNFHTGSITKKNYTIVSQSLELIVHIYLFNQPPSNEQDMAHGDF